MTRAFPIGIALLALSAGGCPGSLDPSLLNQGGTCDAMPIFMKYSCSTSGACHDVNGSAANFDMATTGWQTHLVGVNPKGGGAVTASSCSSNGPYLQPTVQPAMGLFLQKLNGTQTCGGRMPAVGGPLTASELDCVQKFANTLVMMGAGTPTGGTSGTDGAAGQ